MSDVPKDVLRVPYKGYTVWTAKPKRKQRKKRVRSTKGLRDPVRTSEMAIMRCDGATLQEIGDAYGISRERVRQVLRRENLTHLERLSPHFVPFDKAEFVKRRITAKVLTHRHVRRSLQRYKAWRRQAATDLRRLAEQLGHTPRYKDLALFYGVDERWVAHVLGKRWLGRTRTKTARGMHRWFHMAGLTPWPRYYPNPVTIEEKRLEV